LGQSITQTMTDMNGVELILDADADTSITADSDDQIDIKIAGADDFQFTANTFTAQSGSTIAAQALTATTIAVSNDGTIGSAGDADSMAISSAGVVTFTQSPVFPDGSLAVADLDIDGATDIGAAIVDADLFVVDDGAGGTNRKVTASRLKTYAQSGLTSDSIIDADSNTKIQVEESSDENIIRFDVEGTETAIMTAKGLELGAAGGFFLNQTTNSQTVTIAAAENAMMVGPVAFSGTVTVAGVLAII
jgi:hypothetical protein